MRVLFLATAALVLAACGGGSRSTGGSGGPTPSATSVRAPLPPNLGSHYSVELDHVSCAAAGDCAATGEVYEGANARALLWIEHRGRWTVTAPPLPHGLPAGLKSGLGLGSVSCPAVGRCIAVAGANSGSQSDALVLTQRGSGWRETVMPLPAGAKGGRLSLVSCPAVGACTLAGGYLDRSGDEQGFFVTQTPGGWGSPVTEQLPPNATPHPQASFGEEGYDPSALSCTSAHNCGAVSIYIDDMGSPQGVLLTETDGTWARGVEAQLPANATTAEGSYLYPVTGMDGVSCAGANDCTAVGGYGDAQSNQFGMTLAEHAGRWAAAQEVSLPKNAGLDPQQGDAPESPMFAIACPAAGSCAATGVFQDKHGTRHGLLLDEQAGKWTPSEAVPSNADVGALACASAGNCLAVGSVLIAERGGQWGSGVSIPLPTDAKKSSGYLSAVSCPQAGACVAIGAYADRAGRRQGVIVTIPRP